MQSFLDFYREHSQLFYNLQLVLAMLGMGANTTVGQFRGVFRRPWAIALVLALQFLLMPLFAVLLARTMPIDPAIGVGLVLLAALPSGTLSNIITFLGRGNVPLSVTATCASTVTCLIVTPIVIELFASKALPEHFQMPLDRTIWSIFILLLMPLAAGMAIGHFWHKNRHHFAKLAVWGSTIALVGVWVGALGGGQIEITQYGWIAPGVIVLFVVASQIITFELSKLLGYSRTDGFTQGIEVSMRNGNLGLALLIPLFGVLTPTNVYHQGALYTMLFGGGAMTVFGLLYTGRRHLRFARQRRAGLEEV
ncbi:bile acid:sodium symporter family protein [Aeoliella sp. ICT_H6.2]|uniref:Bile acid:sodium symporter family protein n=1 Tax=Aeoliella straminimaris TaxID=2954799 RepID=A0A9X2FGL3_9BACT|nr:bile acid:sodium symporter family protein [Aeoliella straminimaris]MCO6047782.1 bile acid:sodium symporter family protein [Aeoliella straminimaris]